ncbi:MAG: prohibitin family protein [Desulfobacterales bacterium]|nr:prohibitin family protein [Desulfobacterales bacterium]
MAKVYQKLKDHMGFLTTIILIILILFLLLFNRIVFLIGPGEAGVLYRTFSGGTVTTRVYEEGIQFIWPWNKMYVYNTRVQEVPHDFDVLTKNGLKIYLKMSIRYRPEYKLLGVLHKQVGEDYANIVVIPEIENVIRVLIGRNTAEQVYTTKQPLLEKAINGAIEEIAQRYVNVDDVIIKRMKLPDSVEESIKRKIRQKHRADAYKFRLEREKQEKIRKRIEAEGLERFRKALTSEVLHWMGIQATIDVANSQNAKTVIIGQGKEGLPLIGSLPLEPFNQYPPKSEEEMTKDQTEPEKEKPHVPEAVPTDEQGGNPTGLPEEVKQP